jgi:hypothetical protein
MEELHTDSIDGGHEASYGLGHVPGRGRTPTMGIITSCLISHVALGLEYGILAFSTSINFVSGLISRGRPLLFSDCFHFFSRPAVVLTE